MQSNQASFIPSPEKRCQITNMAGGEIAPAGTHNVVKQNMSNWQQDFSFSQSNQLRHFLLKKTQPTLVVQGMKEVTSLSV